MIDFKSDAPQVINGDLVIGFTNGKKLKDLNLGDAATISKWYQEDPTKNHLGLINLHENMGDTTLPMYKDFFKNKAVMEVNGVNGAFTYDLPVSKNSSGGATVVRDSSTYSTNPGIDGALFPLYLDEAYRPGDVLIYDAYYGQQVLVSEDKPIENESSDGSWVHWVTLVTNDPQEWFPTEKLTTGTTFYKISHSLGEFSTQFSGITNPESTGTIKCEFVLGNHRGVETSYTMYGNSKNFSGASVSTKQFLNEWEQEQSKIAVDENGKPLDMFYVSRLRNGKIDKDNTRVGAMLEKFALSELMRLEAYSLIFQKGALITDINGTKRLNEGIIPQLRRGHLIRYSRPGAIGIDHLAQAVGYLYKQKSTVPMEKRHVKFRAGKMAYSNIMDIIQRESLRQLQRVSDFNGMESLLPSKPVTGKDLMDLTVNPIGFGRAFFNSIGWIEVEHDVTLDYQPMTTRSSRGFFGNEGYPDSSYTAMIEDVMNPSYSSPNDKVAGASLVANGSKTANLYYVKPEGEGFYMGYSNGRWAPDKAIDIASSSKHMSREFWTHSVSAAWVRDIGKSVIIELKR